MRIDHGDILSRIQLLRQDWLITLSRNQTTDTTYLSAWHLNGSTDSHCAAKVEVAGHPSKFAAAVRNGGNSVIIALFNNYRISGGVEIFSLSLTDDYIFEDAPVSPLKRVAEISYSDKPAPGYDSLDHRGMFVEVQVNNNLVAVSLARINRSGPPLTYQIILVDMCSLAAVVISKTIAEDVTCSRFIFKLLPSHIAILFSGQNEGSLYWQDIRDALKLCSSAGTLALNGTRHTTFFMDRLPIFDIGTLQPTYTSGFFGMLHDVFFTAEVIRTTQSTLGIISRRLERLWAFRLTLSPASPGWAPSLQVSLELTSSLRLKTGLNIENLALGRTGYRMVLLERSWETDEYKLKKVTLPMPGRRTNVAVHDLIPSQVALPFELHQCISIWFEEATGRVCFGLHTGQMYLLDV
ncbi:hypothetical protein D9756_001719 [Leucocoprinus leucothites]|uniref:Uncharacterized protein n=1 Tax=Leucocoprinus leucothites TaxID=201217 RepID=A0A8H5G4W7_9AGAR|nr:hypothetical protein D9756_001719 [Leucoagaricus leucothites]